MGILVCNLEHDHLEEFVDGEDSSGGAALGLLADAVGNVVGAKGFLSSADGRLGALELC